MTSSQLVRFVNQHDPATARDNGDGTLIVSSWASDMFGNVIPEHFTIPATLKACRDLLGY